MNPSIYCDLTENRLKLQKLVDGATFLLIAECVFQLIRLRESRCLEEE